MFPVDLLHGLLRHSLAAHKRETVAFGRRLNAIVERLFPDREGVDGLWLELYRRDWTTPELPSNTRHRKVFTY